MSRGERAPHDMKPRGRNPRGPVSRDAWEKRRFLKPRRASPGNWSTQAAWDVSYAETYRSMRRLRHIPFSTAKKTVDVIHIDDAEIDKTMPTVLLVPMHIDALYVAENTNVRKALADYSKLPYEYQDSNRHWNASGGVPSANLSETILSPPMDTDTLPLGPGIHLHWALPAALTHSAEQDADGAHRFPVVPNRFLVTRSRNEKIEQQWVVESDYLAPDLTMIQPPDSVAVPFPFNNLNGPPYQPFRFMGRKVDPKEWSQVDPKKPDYLGTYGLALTATGVTESVPTLDHVKATFAAFYPNCQGVFGLHDDDSSVLNALSGVTYDVLGWYADPAQDCTAAFSAGYTGKGTTQRMADFEDRFEWTFDPGSADFPQRTVLYGRVTFQNEHKDNPAATEPKIELSIGNSPTEALSAYLAQCMANTDKDQTNKSTYEEQLEAIQVADRLNQSTMDLGAAFNEARHTKGFTPRPGGILWSVQQADTSTGNDEITLLDELAHKLSQLNDCQKTYDRALDTIVSLGERLFSDFCAWMFISYYHDEDQTDDIAYLRTNLDSLYGVVDQGALAPLRKYMTDTGRLVFQMDPKTGNVTATPAEVIIRLISDANGYFQNLLDNLNGVNGNLGLADSSNVSKSIKAHFADCGITLSPNATVSGESPKWKVSDGGVDYPIVQNDHFLELHIPPFASQTACQLASALKDFIATLEAKAPQCVLRPTAAPRYWQPNDPVALMVGTSAITTERFGIDDLLPCTLLSGPVDDADLLNLPNDPKRVLTNIREAVEGIAKSSNVFGFTSWTAQPWNPFMLVWNVQYFPNVRSGKYASDAITGSYQLSTDGCDLSPNNAAFTTNAEEYSGFSILTPHASEALKQDLAAFIAGEYSSLPEPYNNDLATLPDEKVQEYLDKNIAALQTDYEKLSTSLKDPIRTAMRAYAIVKDKPCLSQALGGFNDALLTMKRTMQLDVSDPMYSASPPGDDPDPSDSMLLATEISGLVGDALLRAPNPYAVFSSIRSGKLKITGLHLVDSFGQVNNLSFEGATTSAEVMPKQSDGTILLLPRLSQPARMLFRWLSATRINDQDDQEMNAHPATSPICGWVLPNNLDSSLMVYDASGAMQGLVDEQGVWMPAPGSAQPVAVNDIVNPHLQQLVKYLTSAGDNGETFMSAFLTAIENSLEKIDPENFAQHEGLALLMGRPLALVRASLSLEVQGLPARDNSRGVIKETVGQYIKDSTSIDTTTTSPIPDRFTSAFNKVLFPVRIGEPGQLNDGLVGYWVEDAKGTSIGETFYAPGGGSNAAYNGVSGPSVVTALTNLQQSMDAPASIVTMLVDPRGVVHATSGILPSKPVSIPPDQYADALKRINITFLTAPILVTGTDYDAPDGSRKVPLTLPNEPGYTWSWLSQQSRTWSETQSFSAADTSAKFAGQQWICEGWLQLKPNKDG